MIRAQEIDARIPEVKPAGVCPPPQAVRPKAITLIHGTFGARSKWTMTGSTFATSLHKALPSSSKLFRFQWSGKNSNSERIFWAQKLSQHIKNVGKAYPDHDHFIVTHSHGGNVALYSLRDEDARAHISGIACMNTPFVGVIPRNPSNVLLIAAFVAFYLLWGVGIAFMVLMYNVFGGDKPLNLSIFYNSSWLSLYYAGYLLGGIVLIAKIILISLMVALPSGLIIVAGIFGMERLKNLILNRRNHLIGEVALPTNRSVPVLCLWSVGDEVINTLNALAVLSHLPFLVLNKVMIVVCSILIGYFTAQEVFPTIPIYDYMKSLYPELIVRGRATAAPWMLSASLYCLALVATLFLIVALSNLITKILPFGISVANPLNSVLIRLSFTLVPLNSYHAEYVTVDPPPSLLGHTQIYNNVQAIEVVARWIAQHGQTRIDSPN